MKYPLYLAPMEDVTDPSFRMLCKRFGADRVYSEFINADALVRDVSAATRKLTISDAERPVAIQIYGKDATSMAEAAQIVEQAKPDVIDINFGCPVKKVAGKGAGAGLLRDIPRMLEITKAVVNAVKTPVTAKTRLGWNSEELIIVDLAEALQDCGISELAIHGRTRAQMYTGEADWTLIGEVKNNPRMHIPIIGNGDVTTPERAWECFQRYGVDAIMVGRATFGCPWIFWDMKQYINQMSDRCAVGCQTAALSDDAKPIDILKEYVDMSIEWCGDERKGIIHSRRHFANSPIFKGLPDFKQTRIALLRADTKAEVFALMDEIEEKWLATNNCVGPRGNTAREMPIQSADNEQRTAMVSLAK